jgi:hypothetical protein
MQINIILDALFIFSPKTFKMERKLEKWIDRTSIGVDLGP